jgi:hypothetical protein
MARDRILKLDDNESILVLDSEVVRKVEEKRGNMSHSEFLKSLLDGQPKETPSTHDYLTKEEFHQFEQGMKKLLRHFLEFFLSYGLELSNPPQDEAFNELSQKLQSLSSSSNQAKQNAMSPS